MSTLANTSNSDAFALPRNRRSNRARNKQNSTQQQIAGVADIAVCSDFQNGGEGRLRISCRVAQTNATRLVNAWGGDLTISPLDSAINFTETYVVILQILFFLQDFMDILS